MSDEHNDEGNSLSLEDIQEWQLANEILIKFFEDCQIGWNQEEKEHNASAIKARFAQKELHVTSIHRTVFRDTKCPHCKQLIGKLEH